MNYTVIAYKSSGQTTCRGCVMDSWDSDFEVRTFVDQDRAAEWVANIKFNDYLNLGSYEFKYLVDGLPMDAYDFDGEWTDDHDDLRDEITRNFDVESKASTLVSDKIAEHKAKKEADRLAAFKREQDYKKEKDLELLAKLKQQYGE